MEAAPARSPGLGGYSTPRAWRGLVVLGFLLVAAAGCAAPGAPAPTASDVVLRLDPTPRGSLVGNDVEWIFWVKNTGTGDADGATVQLQVQHFRANIAIGTGDSGSVALDRIPAGDIAIARLRTPYHGMGDDRGNATLTWSNLTLDRQAVKFETCAMPC